MYRTLRALTVLVALACLIAVAASAESTARVVRLSVVEGAVQIDRATGQGFEKAFLNMPIAQGMQVRTGADGRAEVEFEDGSTVRLTPNTAVQFTDLGLRDSGAKVSTTDLSQGMAYFEILGEKGDEFLVTFSRQKISLTRAAHFRVDVQNGSGEVAVFDGKVQVDGPQGAVEVAKKQTATFDLGTDKYELAKKVVPDGYDQWDKQQSQYSQRRTMASSYHSPYAYGWSDLAYYGSFSNLAGYGSCWQPYFTGASWSPFMDGAWVYYPSFGYTWVSAYPWGWMPYHYGSWMYAGGSGWCWLPSYNSMMAYGPVFNAVPVVGPRRPPRFTPPRPPVIHNTGVVAVGRGPSYSAPMPGTHRVVIRGGDAGLGIPRSHDNLGKINRTFLSKGTATVPVPRTAVVVPVPSGAETMARPGMTRGNQGGAAMPHTGIQHTSPRSAEGPRMSSPRMNSGPRMSSPPPSRGSSPPARSSPSTSSSPRR
jgi:hypothetical protein